VAEVQSRVHLEHSVMLLVWCLSSIQNVVQISAIVTRINTLMLWTFIWWRLAN